MLFFSFLLFLTIPSLTLTTNMRGKVKFYRVNKAGETPTEYIGTLRLTQFPDGRIRINRNLVKLPRGFHGFHIHERPDLSNGCLAAGPHLNLHNMTHGGLRSKVKHEGDLGNIYANKYGLARVNVIVSGLEFGPPFNLFNRSIVVHERIDDLGRVGGK